MGNTGNSEQHHEALQALVGRALIDPAFRRGLLNGHRQACLDEFDLAADERRVASAIRADDLEAFARQLDDWIEGRRRTRVLEMPSAPRPTWQSIAAR